MRGARLGRLPLIADDVGFTQMFWQEGGAVDESFTPAFDTTGVLRSASAG